MSKSRMSKVAFLILCVFCVNVATPAFADDLDITADRMITSLKKGERAPYAGVLVSTMLAAEINANCDPDTIEQRCAVKTGEAVALEQSECKKKTDILSAALDAEKTACKKIIAAKDEELKILRDKIAPPPWYKSPAFYFVGGVLSGAAAVLGGAYAVSLISK